MVPLPVPQLALDCFGSRLCCTCCLLGTECSLHDLVDYLRDISKLLLALAQALTSSVMRVYKLPDLFDALRLLMNIGWITALAIGIHSWEPESTRGRQ